MSIQNTYNIATNGQIRDNDLVLTNNEAISYKKRSRGWVFTVFHTLQVPPVHFPTATFQAGQYEKCPTTGRIHYQGMVHFEEAITAKTFLSKFPVGLNGKKNVYVDVMKGTVLQAYKYVRKEDPYHDGAPENFRYEHGTPPVEKTEAAKTKADNTSACILNMIKAGATLKDVTNAYPAMAVRSLPNIMGLMKIHAPQPEMILPHSLRTWQRQLILFLCNKANDRTIHWIYDPEGGAGKTTVIRYCIKNLNATLLDGKKADMAHMYNGQRIVFFDLSRTSEGTNDHLYAMAESLKNGMMPSPKYDSTIKHFKSPHVLFMSNSYPKDGAWSRDRLHLTTLSQLTTSSTLGLDFIPTFDAPYTTDIEVPDVFSALTIPTTLPALGAGDTSNVMFTEASNSAVQIPFPKLKTVIFDLPAFRDMCECDLSVDTHKHDCDAINMYAISSAICTCMGEWSAKHNKGCSYEKNNWD